MENFVIQNENQRFKMMLKTFVFRLAYTQVLKHTKICIYKNFSW